MHSRHPHPFLSLGFGLAALLACGIVAAPSGLPRQAGSTSVSPKHPQIRRESRPDFPGEAEEFFLAQRLPAGPAGESLSIPDLYLAAQAEMARMPRHSLATGRTVDARGDKAALGTWTPLGPGNIGGRTRALLVDPRDPEVLYAAGSSGGVWKTTDAGESWRPLDDLLPNLSVNSLALDPRHPDTVYAGTGEGYFNQNAVQGAGIFRTTDAGATWARLAATANGQFAYVNDLQVSPVASSRLYASTRTGVWRSLDAGVSWQRVLDPKVGGGCYDLALRTLGRDDVLFAACGTRAQGTVYRNTQANGPAGAWMAVLRETGISRTSLAIAPSNPDVIYALADSVKPGPFRLGMQALFRSDRGGEKGSFVPVLRNSSGDKLSTLLLTNPLFAFASECGLGDDLYANLGWFANSLAVDPQNPDRVWAGGVDLFRSDDGGRTFRLASNWWDTGQPNFVHADQHVIVFDPRYDARTRPILYVGNDGGVFRTDNATAGTYRSVCDPSRGQVAFRALNHGYAITQFYHGLPYPDGSRYIAGAQDNGVVRGTDATGLNGWEYVQLGDGGYVALDPQNPDNLYVENSGPSLLRSTDGGVTFAPATAGINEPPPGFLFIVPFTMDPSDAKRLWLGGSFLWRTVDGAAHWTRASARLPGSRPRTSAIAVAPTNPNKVLAGTDQGFIVRTAGALSTGQDRVWPSAKPRDGVVSWLTIDPRDPQVAYATYSTFGGNHVFKSTDGGATWASIDGTGSGRLPNLPAHVLAVDPRDGRRLYLGTDMGIFVSTDGGGHWAVENTGFASVLTESLSLQQKPDGKVTLFAFTRGRGAWKVDLAE